MNPCGTERANMLFHFCKLFKLDTHESKTSLLTIYSMHNAVCYLYIAESSVIWMNDETIPCVTLPDKWWHLEIGFEYILFLPLCLNQGHQFSVEDIKQRTICLMLQQFFKKKKSMGIPNIKCLGLRTFQILNFFHVRKYKI